MIRAPLHLIGPDDAPPTQTLAERIAGMQAALVALNAEQLSELRADLLRVAEIATGIAENPTQPPGIRDLSRRLSDDCETRMHSISAIAARSAR